MTVQAPETVSPSSSQTLAPETISRPQAIENWLIHFYQKLPASVRLFVRPMFYIALALHVALLFAPLSRETKSSEPETEPTPQEKEVKITRLPSPQASAKATPKSTPKSTPTPKTSPPPRTVNPRQSVAPPIPQPTPQRQPETQLNEQPQQEVQNSPREPSNPNNESTPPPPPPASLADFFNKFPPYPGASAGSGGVLRPDFDSSAYIYHVGEGLDAVAAKFEQLLPAAEFEVAPQTSEANFKVYQVSLGSLSQYLHLISQDGKIAMVVLPQPYSLEDLKEAQTGEIDPNSYAFIQITTDFGSEYGPALTSPDRSLLVEPGQFADTNQFEIKSMTGAAFLNPPSEAEMINFYQQRLSGDGFSFDPIGNYGGGEVYRVARESFEIYLIFAPTTKSRSDGSPGTAAILSNSNPL